VRRRRRSPPSSPRVSARSAPANRSWRPRLRSGGAHRSAGPAGGTRQSRARRLSGVLPLLADAENAQAAREYSRAVQDYTQVLTLDPKNAQARLGLARSSAASGDDSYAKAAGEGFAALVPAASRKRALPSHGARPASPADRGSGGPAAGQCGQRRARLRSDPRARRGSGGAGALGRGVQLYSSALRQDRSLVFAQEGRARATGACGSRMPCRR